MHTHHAVKMQGQKKDKITLPFLHQYATDISDVDARKLAGTDSSLVCT